MPGPETVVCEEETLYGRDYLVWKKETLRAQKSDHKTNNDFYSADVGISILVNSHYLI